MTGFGTGVKYGFNTVSSPTYLDPPKDFFVEAAEGTLADYAVVQKFGSCSAIDGNFHHVWEANTNSNDLVFLSAASALYVSSSNTNDTFSGTGARSAYVQALDANFDTSNVYVELSGTTPVALSGGPYLRVNRAFVDKCGTYGGANVGTIDICVSGVAKPDCIQARIDASFGQTRKTQYTIPNGYVGMLKAFAFTTEATKTASFRIFRRENTELIDHFHPKRILGEWLGLSDVATFENYACPKLTETTDIWIEARNVGAGDIFCAGTLDIILEKE